MLKSTTKRLGKAAPFVSRKRQLISEVKEHAGWKDEISLCEAADLLKGHAPFTYILSQGFDESHFFLSFVTHNGMVKHKNLRVIIDQGEWRIKNGGGCSFESVTPVIPSCLHCSVDKCHPLT